MEIPASALEQMNASVLIAMLAFGFVMTLVEGISTAGVYAGQDLLSMIRQQSLSAPRARRINRVFLQPIASLLETHKPYRPCPTYYEPTHRVGINQRSAAGAQYCFSIHSIRTSPDEHTVIALSPRFCRAQPIVCTMPLLSSAVHT